MTRTELWKIYTDKNPHFLTDGAHLTAEGLKKFFDQAYAQGYKEGRKDGHIQGGNRREDMFNNIFGGGFK